MTSPKNSADGHPDAHACRLKISLVSLTRSSPVSPDVASDSLPDCVLDCLPHQVMLDSPVSPGWDLSVEMASYVRKLQHVSANCRLSVDEELTLLSRCVCDPSDRRFDEVCAPHCSSRVISRSRPKADPVGAERAPESAPRQRGTETECSEAYGRPTDACQCSPGVSAHHGARSSSQALHSVHSVLLCKNRRSALRARQAGSLSCAVELPPRPEENRWIYAWSSQVINGL